MRIAIDLQGRQSSESKNRGIGRYSLAIAKAIAQNRGNHEVLIVLSSVFPDEIEEIKREFENLLTPKNIHIWSSPNHTSFLETEEQERKSAELDRELFLRSLNPDIVYITSLFEGLAECVVTSINTAPSNTPVAVTLYDLIPLLNEKLYLNDPDYKQWYLEKIEHLMRADLLLAISSSSRQEALDYLNCDPDRVVNIGTAADTQFHSLRQSPLQREELLGRYTIKNDFLMYTGGVDHRKNIDGLIRSYSLLPKTLRSQHQLVIVCFIDAHTKGALETLAKQKGLEEDEVIFTGYVPEEDLIRLYSSCKAFIFPSWHEGFGLPVLEAMRCGAPVIAANTSSLPEVVGLKEALFDPYDISAMADKIEQVLTDTAFREKLLNHASKQIKKFSWDISAKKALNAFEKTEKVSRQRQTKSYLLITAEKLIFS